jgi:rhodanese-related sulfurtransferase
MSGLRRYFTYLLAPLLLASYPVVFLYRQNARILHVSSMVLPLLVCLGICVLCYSLLFLLLRSAAVRAANASLGLILPFLLYGAAYAGLLDLDVVPVHHMTLLPGMALGAVYLARALARMRPSRAISVNRGVVFVLGALTAFNVVGIGSIELHKAAFAREDTESATGIGPTTDARSYPDIYYIVLDEFAGFDAVREYWGYRGVDEFEAYLSSRRFFVASESRSRTLKTQIEMASRFNYEPLETDRDIMFYLEAMARNRVMQLLKSHGYTTVILDGLGGPFALPGRPPMDADYSFVYQGASTAVLAAGLDEFAAMVLDLTVLRVASDQYRQQFEPLVAATGNNILFTFEKLTQLDEVPRPMFVYAHIMLPHFPFIFDENGSINDPDHLWDWDYYLGSYIFATKLARRLVGELLESADPARQPVIVLQSDHGARNHLTDNPGSAILLDYPEDLHYHILNALYLPGYDYSALEEDLDPINTFPLILNFYLGENLPLR